MATYTTLRKGSRGQDVTNLQNALNAAGYNLTPDSKFGPKTEAAVRDYQSKNGLVVDGKAGNQTLGKLYGTSPTTTTSPSTTTRTSSTAQKKTPTNAQYDPTAVMKGVAPGTATQLKRYSTGYQPTPAVNQALEALNAQLGQKPGDYVSQWSKQIGEMWNQIRNPEPYSYDFTTDPVYLQYRDRYMSQGRTAMQDATANAATLTGGYGNSYAQQAGQQTYNAYLQQLNDVIPELEQLNYQRWRDRRDDLMTQYQLANQQENQDYDRYRDQYGDWRDEVARLQDFYGDERQFGYNQWADMLSFYQNAAAQEQDQANWQRQFDYQQEQDRLAQKQAARSSGGGSTRRSSSSRGSGGGGNPTPTPTPEDQTSETYNSRLGYYRTWLNSGGTPNAIIYGINTDEYLSPEEKANVIIALNLKQTPDTSNDDYYKAYQKVKAQSATPKKTTTKGGTSKRDGLKSTQLKH